jgi:hypothetical protein
MTQDGTSKDDVKVPDSELGKQIEQEFEGGKDLLVTIVSAMGEEQVKRFTGVPFSYLIYLPCSGHLLQGGSKRLLRARTHVSLSSRTAQICTQMPLLAFVFGTSLFAVSCMINFPPYLCACVRRIFSRALLYTRPLRCRPRIIHRNVAPLASHTLTVSQDQRSITLDIVLDQ